MSARLAIRRGGKVGRDSEWRRCTHPVRGGGVHRGGILVHRVHLVREPGGDHRAGFQRHLRGNSFSRRWRVPDRTGTVLLARASAGYCRTTSGLSTTYDWHSRYYANARHRCRDRVLSPSPLSPFFPSPCHPSCHPDPRSFCNHRRTLTQGSDRRSTTGRRWHRCPDELSEPSATSRLVSRSNNGVGTAGGTSAERVQGPRSNR
jgi:hypothetical protein